MAVDSVYHGEVAAKVLELLPTGADKPIKRAKLLRRLQMDFPDVNDREMRRAIKNLVRNLEPIVPGRWGSSRAANMGEVKAGVRYLRKKARTIDKIADRLLEAGYKHFGRQMEFGEEVE